MPIENPVPADSFANPARQRGPHNTHVEESPALIRSASRPASIVFKISQGLQWGLDRRFFKATHTII